MGWGKRIMGGLKVAAGALSGNPGLAVSGGADIAGSFGDKKAPGVVYQGQQRTIGPGPQPPAGSIEQSRGQNKQRMKSIYNYP